MMEDAPGYHNMVILMVLFTFPILFCGWVVLWDYYIKPFINNEKNKKINETIIEYPRYRRGCFTI